ncbi:MAG: tetratricopeptide repeat protein [Phycisphaerae bacterium]|nr:tetratricopeptide repeat protein [Phycisphaerae bacterium]
MTRRAKKRILILGAAVVALVAAGAALVFVQRAQRHRLVTEKLASAMQAEKEGRFEDAVKDFLYFYGQKKDNAEANLAFARARRAVPEEANRHLGAAVLLAKDAAQRMPGQKPPLELLLDLYAQMGMVPEGLATADDLLKIDPKHAEALLTKCGALIQLGKNEDALSVARAYTTAWPEDVSGHILVFDLSTRVGNLRTQQEREALAKELRDEADKVSQRFPENVALAILRAKIHGATGQFASAVEIAKQAADMRVTKAEDLAQLLGLLDAVNLGDRSERVLEREIQAGTVPDAVVVAAERAYKTGRVEVARNRLGESVRDPLKASDRSLGWYLTLQQSLPGGIPKDSPLFAELKRRKSTEAKTWASVIEARTSLLAGDFSVARLQFMNIAGRGGPGDLSLFFLGQAEASLGEWRKAVKAWAAAIERDRSWITAHVALITTLLANDELDDAFEAARRAFQAAPSLPTAVLVVQTVTARVEAKRAKPEEVADAVKMLDQIAVTLTKSGDLLAMRARILLATDKIEDARKVVRTIIDTPALPTGATFAELANALRKRNLKEADELLAVGGRLAAPDPETVFALAISAWENGRPDEGKVALRKAIDTAEPVDKRRFEFVYLNYLDRIGDPEAADKLAAVAKEYPSSAAAQLTLLNSQSGWNKPEAVKAAIERLKLASGEKSSPYLLMEARRILTFEASDQGAASVITILEPLTRGDTPDATALSLTAEAFVMLKDRKKAIDFLTRAVVTAPEQPRFYPRLISLLQQAGDTENAERRLREFIQIPNVPTVFRRVRADFLVNQGMFAEAQAELKVLADAGAENDQIAYANVLVRRGLNDDAAKAYDALLKRASVSAPAVTAAAEFFALRGDVDRAMKTMDRMPESVSPERRAIVRATLLGRNNRAADAEKILKDAAVAGSGAPAADVYAELARLYATQKKNDLALAAVNEGLKKAPDHARLRGLASLLRVAGGSKVGNESLPDLEQALAAGATTPAAKELVKIMADMDRNPGDIEGVRKRLAAITDTEPTYYPAWQLLVVVQMRAGLVDDAVRTSTAAARTLPSDPRPARLATEVLFAAGRTTEAYTMAQQWRQRCLEDTFFADVTLTRLETVQGKPEAALKLIEPWKARINADLEANADALALLGEVLALNGRDKDGDALLWPLAQKDREWAMRYLAAAKNLCPGRNVPKPRPDTARDWFTRVEPLIVNEPRGRLILGQAWLDLAITSKSAADFARVSGVLEPLVQDAAHKLDALLMLATAKDLANDLAGAEKMYREAMAVAPDKPDPAVLNNLAFLLVRSERNADEAVALATKALDLASRAKRPPAFMVSLLDTLGAAQLLAKQPAEAEKTFREAIKIDARRPDSLLGLAEALADLGKKEQVTDILNGLEDDVTSKRLDPELIKRHADLRRRVQ